MSPNGVNAGSDNIPGKHEFHRQQPKSFRKRGHEAPDDPTLRHGGARAHRACDTATRVASIRSSRSGKRASHLR